MAEQQERLRDHTQGCQNVLDELDRVLVKYRPLDIDITGFRGKSQKLFTKLKFEPDDIKDLRSRISSSVSLLTHFHVQLTR